MNNLEKNQTSVPLAPSEATPAPPYAVLEGLWKPGERPMGGAINLMELALLRAQASPERWVALSHEACLSQVTALRALANTPLDPTNPRWIVPLLAGLPLFFSAAQACQWEQKGGWKKMYGPHNEEYAALLQGPHPSIAYQWSATDDRDIRNQAFAIWIAETSMSEFRGVLRESAARLERWFRSQPGHRENPVFEKTEHLAQALGESVGVGRLWGMAEALGDLAPCRDVWMGLMKRRGWGLRHILKVWGEAWNIPNGEMVKIGKKDSKWVQLGFFKLVSEDDWKHEHHLRNWDDCWKDWTNQRAHRAALQAPAPLIHAFAQPFHETPATWTLPAWVDQWKAALQQSQPMNLLLCGPEDTGVTAVLAKILAAAGKVAWVPPAEILEKGATSGVGGVPAGYSIRAKDGAPLDSSMIAESCNPVLAATLKIVASQPDSVLFAQRWASSISSDNLSGNMVAHEVLSNPQCHQVWWVKSLKGVPGWILAKFHDIREVEPPSIADRRTLAREWFGDESSLQIARAVSSPQRIKSLGQWCQQAGGMDWPAIVDRLTAEDRASPKKQDDQNGAVEVLRPNTANLPPMAGYPEAKRLLRQTVDALANPDRYHDLGARMPRGALLLGPPGCGKTLLARHIAAQVDVPLLVVDTAAASKDIDQLRAVFREARRRAPCVVFLDEADVLLQSPVSFFGTVDIHKQRTVNAMLSELDGIHTHEGVFVIAATHRGNNLDSAITRSGRLSDVLTLGLPGPEDREAIWNAHMARRKLAPDVQASTWAKASVGLSGADIDETLNRAALLAARSQAPEISNAMLAAACDEVYWGSAHDSMHMKEESRWTTAVHEAGHAIVAWGYGLEVPRLTVRPRRHALGMTQWQREEGCYNASRSGHLGQMALAMGGMAAEKVVFGHYGMGGKGDLDQVRNNVTMLCATGQEGLGLAVVSSDPTHWSDGLRQKAESHAHGLIEQAMGMAEECLIRQKEGLLEFAAFLLEHRELSGLLLEPWVQRFQGGGEFPPDLPMVFHHPSAVGATVHTQGPCEPGGPPPGKQEGQAP